MGARRVVSECDPVQVGRGRGIRPIWLDRDRLDELGGADRVDERAAAQLVDRGGQRAGAVAEVRAECDDGLAPAGDGSAATSPSKPCASRRFIDWPVRSIVTATSANGSGMGASGLCTVTRTRSTSGDGEERVGDPGREGLEQVDRVARHDLGDALGRLAVVDGVGDIVGLRRRGGCRDQREVDDEVLAGRGAPRRRRRGARRRGARSV